MNTINPNDPNRGVMLEAVFWMVLAIVLLVLVMLGFSVYKGYLCAAPLRLTSGTTFGSSAES